MPKRSLDHIDHDCLWFDDEKMLHQSLFKRSLILLELITTLINLR